MYNVFKGIHNQIIYYSCTWMQDFRFVFKVNMRTIPLQEMIFSHNLINTCAQTSTRMNIVFTYRAFLLLHFHFSQDSTSQRRFNGSFPRSCLHFQAKFQQKIVQHSFSRSLPSLISLLSPVSHWSLDNLQTRRCSPAFVAGKFILGTWMFVSICIFFPLFYRSFQQIMPLFTREVRLRQLF